MFGKRAASSFGYAPLGKTFATRAEMPVQEPDAKQPLRELEAVEKALPDESPEHVLRDACTPEHRDGPLARHSWNRRRRRSSTRGIRARSDPTKPVTATTASAGRPPRAVRRASRRSS